MSYPMSKDTGTIQNQQFGYDSYKFGTTCYTREEQTSKAIGN